MGAFFCFRPAADICLEVITGTLILLLTDIEPGAIGTLKIECSVFVDPTIIQQLNENLPSLFRGFSRHTTPYITFIWQSPILRGGEGENLVSYI